MDLEIISKLLSLHCNNAEIIAQEETGAYNVTLKEMPDVLAFDKSVNRLFVINLTNLESKNSKAYVDTMESQLSQCQMERVYIFVYQSRSVYARKASEPVWGSHIWCIEEPEHIIHLR